jgi:hypothetical protein
MQDYQRIVKSGYTPKWYHHTPSQGPPLSGTGWLPSLGITCCGERSGNSVALTDLEGIKGDFRRDGKVIESVSIASSEEGAVTEEVVTTTTTTTTIKRVKSHAPSQPYGITIALPYSSVLHVLFYRQRLTRSLLKAQAQKHMQRETMMERTRRTTPILPRRRTARPRTSERLGVGTGSTASGTMKTSPGTRTSYSWRSLWLLLCTSGIPFLTWLSKASTSSSSST